MIKRDQIYCKKNMMNKMERRLEMSNNLNDLEMAKKRDHKIKITDEAIAMSLKEQPAFRDFSMYLRSSRVRCF